MITTYQQNDRIILRDRVYIVSSNKGSYGTVFCMSSGETIEYFFWEWLGEKSRLLQKCPLHPHS